jgi:hypothetical protein
VSRLRAKPSRCQAIGARLKYIASLRTLRTSFTTFGSNRVCASSTVVARVDIGALPATSASATARIPAAGANGSSPCRLTTTVSSAQPAMRAHSARRSVPEACEVAVIATFTSASPDSASAMR